jgi:hypothetical protein
LQRVSQQHFRIQAGHIAAGGGQTMGGYFQNIQQEI